MAAAGCHRAAKGASDCPNAHSGSRARRVAGAKTTRSLKKKFSTEHSAIAIKLAASGGRFHAVTASLVNITLPSKETPPLAKLKRSNRWRAPGRRWVRSRQVKRSCHRKL